MSTQYATLDTAKFVVGRGGIAFLSKLRKKRIAAVYDGRVVGEELRLSIQKLAAEGGGECRFVADIRNEPFFSDIQKAGRQLEEFQPDMILAVGGGSVMDTAKAMYLFYEHPEMTIADATKPYALPALGRKAILCAVPTTSGTGSETTSAAVFIDPETKAKHLMLSNNLIPDYAILDADFTDSLPAKVASHTGMDALTHAMEASVCVASSGMVASMAMSAALDILENLQTSLDPAAPAEQKAAAREACHIAASLAGVAITNSCAGLAHGFDQPGPFFGLPHGMVCGLMLPYTTAFSSPHRSYETLARRLGLTGKTPEERCKNLVDFLWDYNKSVGIPRSFREIGIDEGAYMEKLSDFASLALQAIATKLSPKTPAKEQAENLLRDAYYGEKPFPGKWDT